MRTRVPLTWTVGHAPEALTTPARRVPAQMPGAVQLDWARAEGWPPYWLGEHAAAYRWMEDVFWTYRTEIPATSLLPGQRLFLVCGGVDYQHVVRVNGEDVHAWDGMFTPFELDLTAHAAGRATLEVLVHPAPKAPGATADRREARASVKPAVSYGWDFHPRLIPLGIWDETFLEIRPATHLVDAEVRYTLADDFSAAHLQLYVGCHAMDLPVRLHWTLTDPSGAIVLCEEFLHAGGFASHGAVLAQPRLWWPRGHGAANLYTSRVELLDAAGSVIDLRTQRVGFRRVRLVLADEVQHEPAGFPKTRRPVPTTLEINGRRIFLKGSNWVPPDIFPGITTADTYRPLIQLAGGANFNLLRAWGGGPVPKESFFDLCDECGLLVWQEFPLACNPYPDDREFLAVLDGESRAIVSRVRRHACLALWSGGNELFNSWSGMDDQSLALRLLNRNCFDLDPLTPFIPTSPLEGIGHGDYRFRDEHGRDVFALFAGKQFTAYPEFGCPGPAPVERLREFIPPEELWPPRPGAAWSMHHGFGAWELEPTGWLCLATQRHYFGDPASLAELVAHGSWLQSEGLRCLFEEARRQAPRCGMALNWCFNEPWPAAANNSLVHWPAHPKPALTAVAAACRPTLASARIGKFSWHAGERFTAELWLLHDAPAPRPEFTITAAVQLGELRLPLARWTSPAGPAAENVRGPGIELVLPHLPAVHEFSLVVAVVGQTGLDSTYRLHYQASPA